MQKIPTAIMMSETGSNAEKIIEDKSPKLDIRAILSDNPCSRAEEIAKNYGIRYELNDIYKHCGVENPPDQLNPDDRIKLKDKYKRKSFDFETHEILRKYGIELVAAAGYDLVMGNVLTDNYLIGNVHPGDLIKSGDNGKPLYAGLSWIPTAKAILNGEKYARTSTHLITSGLDEGPIARVSSPVPINLPEGVTKDNILPKGATLKDIIYDINSNGGKKFGKELIYTHSKMIQNKLKERGDWVEFPLTMHLLAEYMMDKRFSRDGDKSLLLDGREIQHGFLMGI
jgi:folate-dependent phosphoribosylglycinamide formyltransferase PurN